MQTAARSGAPLEAHSAIRAIRSVVTGRSLVVGKVTTSTIIMGNRACLFGSEGFVFEGFFLVFVLGRNDDLLLKRGLRRSFRRESVAFGEV